MVLVSLSVRDIVPSRNRRKSMSKIIVSCILCMAAFCLQASDIIQVSAGTDVTVNDGVFSVGGTNYDNTRSYVLDFAGNSTIAVKSGLVGFGIIATNGTVTLDLTKIGNAEFVIFANHFIWIKKYFNSCFKVNAVLSEIHTVFFFIPLK